MEKRLTSFAEIGYYPRNFLDGTTINPMRIKHAISLTLSALLLFRAAAWAEETGGREAFPALSSDAQSVVSAEAAPEIAPAARSVASTEASLAGEPEVSLQAPAYPVYRDFSPRLQFSPRIASTLAADVADIANSTEPADNLSSGDLWERIRAGFSLGEMDTPLVQENENWYANRPDYMARMIDRSQRYLFYIVEEVEKRGMPSEVALLPMIESAFNPKAYSRAHASGIWQFIPSTGKNFGLQQNWWYDGRRDIMAATGAALDYLQKLHGMFGNWELALAAYNWGEGNMQRSISRNEALGLPTDFLSLRMPPETRNYLPKLLAVKHIIADPQAFGLELASIPNQPYFTRVATKKRIDMALAARLAETSANELASLNPGHNRPVINNKDSDFLLLPADKADIFANNLENYDKPLVSWQSYKLGRGEKLDSVARRFSISVTRLKEVNSIGSVRRRLAGGTLLVPLGKNDAPPAAGDENALAGNYAVHEEQAAASVGKRIAHVVKKGDTLFSIAHRYDVAPEQIKALNHLKSNRLALGQKLVVNKPVYLASAKQANAPAKPGATANKSSKFARAKPLKPSRIAAAKSPATHYTVRHGDTLSSIAKRFNVAANDIQRTNNLSGKRPLSPGSKVIIPGRS